MSILKNLSVTQVTHAELVESTSYYLEILKNSLPEHEFVEEMRKEIIPPLEKLKQALMALRSSDLVEKARKLDLVRGNFFIMFRNMVELYGRSPNEIKKAAHERIWPLIEKAGYKLYGYGDAEQTARTQGLHLELDKAERQADIQELNAMELYNDWKTAEANFEVLSKEKFDAKARQKIPTIKASRAELETVVRDLFPALRMVARTSKTIADFTWIDAMNEKTDLMMAQVAARKTRKDNEDGEEM